MVCWRSESAGDGPAVGPAARGSRRLRPSQLLRIGDAVWALDEFQPVAARLDPAGRLAGVVDWRDLPAPPPGPARPAAADASHLWVQHGDLLGRVDEGGLRATEPVPGLTLFTAGGPGAWLAEVPHIDVGERATDGAWSTPPLPPGGRIVLVTPDGGRHEIGLDRPVTALHADADGLYITVNDRPPTASPTDAGHGSWQFAYHRVTVLLTWSEPFPARIVTADRERVDPVLQRADWPGWMHTGPEDGWLLGGLRWTMGWDRDDDRIEREVLVTGLDREGASQVRLSLGRGSAYAGLHAHGALWFAVHRGRCLHVDEDAPVHVVRLDPVDREVRTVLGTGAVDITDRCWPLPAGPPADADAYATRWLDRLSGLDAFWHPSDGGPPAPLARGLHGSRAALDGVWPDLAVRVTFGHPWYPQGVLTRRIPLFDELGRPDVPEHCDVYLMEDLETGYLPPADEAVEGVLEI